MNSFFNPGRAFSIARKEVRHILRDPFSLAMALGLPVIIVTFFGFAIDFNVKNVRLVSYDRDQTRASRQLEEVFTSSQYFSIVNETERGSLFRTLDRERASAILIIEPGFGKDLGSGKSAKAQIIVDGADNTTTGVILSYIFGIQRAAIKKLVDKAPPAGLDIKTRFLFNPELRSQWFVVPGLTVVVIAILSILMTAMTVAREWETGSMELLLSTPAQPLEIIIGKLVPYIALGLASIVFIYLMARIGFGVPFEGSHLLFALSCLMFLGTTLSQGLLISVVTRQQQLAMQFGMISGLLPTLLLSGFIFPIESMPLFFQYFTSILPAKWFMIISRGIFLKGAGVIELAVPLGALAFLCFLLITAAYKRFKRDLEP